MLRCLSIRNYALIDSLDIEFAEGLNILTGETGSGKSIILGALALILGERADKKSVAEGQSKCIVEGTFELSHKVWRSRFEEHDLDFEDATIFRREIRAGGKSRAFINDTPVSLKIMRDLGLCLVDIHSQHSTMQLNDPRFQLEILDAFTASDTARKAYHQVYLRHRDVVDRLRSAETTLGQRLNELDFVTYQLQELEAVGLDDYDEAAVEEEYNMLAHAEDIARKLHGVLHALAEGEHPATEAVAAAATELSDLSSFSGTFARWAERLHSTSIELADLASEIENHAESVQVDPQRLSVLDQKRADIFRLERKHGVQGVEGLIALRDSLSGKVSGTETLEAEINLLKGEATSLEAELGEVGKKLTAKRKAGLNPLSKRIVERLTTLNMPHARFETRLDKSIPPGPMGLDRAEMWFSSNLGHKLQPIHKIASGGELSRLMLSIKNMAATEERQTLVLDELDTGVSGEVAHAMGGLMREMGETRQVIGITHLPQIASKGDIHFRVYKTTMDGITRTRIDRLDAEERIREIAQMLSGAQTSAAAIDNAKELLAES